VSTSAPYLTLQEVADVNGVSTQSVADWMKHRNLYRYPYRVKSGKKCLIHINIAERYAEGRIGFRPKGYVTLKGLCQDIGINRGGGFVEATLLKGLETVFYHGTAYLSPDDAAVVLERWNSFQPEYGWVPVRESAPIIGRTRQGLTHWAKRNGVELRPYYSGGKVRHFIEERQLLTYLRLCTKSGRAPS